MNVLKFLWFVTRLTLGSFWIYFKGILHLYWKPKFEVIQGVGHAWGKFVLDISRVNLHIQGEENLKKIPAIFITNHQSTLDIFILCALAPYKALPVAKKTLKYIPFVGTFMKKVGVVFIDRFQPDKALQGMLQAKKLAQSGISIIMAPEGTRSRTGELMPFKKGAFYLALETGYPIIPIVIRGAFELYPRDAWMPKPGTVYVEIGEPISTQNWKREPLHTHIQSVRDWYFERIRI